MGSTLVGVLVRGRTAYWVHVGDSRLYLYREGMLTQVTVDFHLDEADSSYVVDVRPMPELSVGSALWAAAEHTPQGYGGVLDELLRGARRRTAAERGERGPGRRLCRRPWSSVSRRSRSSCFEVGGSGGWDDG
jgi:hypothetical protein